jgi:DinB superfamily
MKQYRRTEWFTCLLVTLSFALAMQTICHAQTGSANPVSSAAAQMLGSREKSLVGAAEAMPDNKYSFQPTPQQMTFGHLIEHSVEANFSMCSKLSGAPGPQQHVTEKDGKAKLTVALKESFQYCSGVLTNLSDSKLGDPVELFGGTKGTKATALLYLTGGWADHYGAAAIYLRLNGILPPTAKEKD